MYHADHPISRPDQDTLGRAMFAERLATAIDRLPASGIAKNGYVIAINGGWGIGKTSTIELVVRFLRHLEMARISTHPIVPDHVAHPLSLPTLENMACVFEKIEGRIDDIEGQDLNTWMWEPNIRLRQFKKWLGESEDVAVADAYWRVLVEQRKRSGTIVVRFSPWIFSGHAELAFALMSELARSLGASLGENVRRAFGELLSRLAQLAPLGGNSIDLMTGSGIGGSLVQVVRS